MIPIFKPFMPEGIIPEIEEILYSGNLSYGKIGKKFEESLGRYIGNPKVLTVSSYNQAMLITLSTLGLKYGDEVIASPVSCLASNQPFVIKGLKVVWADVEPDSGIICIEDVKKKITKKTKAIFHNHYCGYLGKINEMNTVGLEYGIPVIDDCIEAFGSELNGKKTGNLGTDISVFSFHTVRLPNTIDGAALVFNNEALFRKATLIRDYGIDRDGFRDELNEINKSCDVKLEGYGALMNEVNSLIGLRQMDSISNHIQQQHKNACRWETLIEEMDDIKKVALTKNSFPNYWVYGILAKNKTETINKIRTKGFYATSVHINNNIYSIFNNQTDLKGVNEFINNFVAIPSGWWMDNNFNYEN